MAKIPFIDLKAQQRRIRPDLERRLKEVLDRGDYIMGAQVAELEEKLCDYCGARYCVACSSGTDALLMPLMAWEVGPEDAVFVPPFTFFASAEMPALLGATPVFVDIEPDTFLMDANALEKAIQEVQAKGELVAKAVMPVDLFGQPAQYEQILPLADKYGMECLEDAAQAFGASRFGVKTCAFGCDAAATSFFPAKPLGCYGDGGAVFTNNPDLAAILRSIRIHGKGADKYDNARIGINGRLDTMQAAVLLAKLAIFPEELTARERIAAAYTERIQRLKDIVPPKVLPGSTSVFAQYCVLAPAEKRDKIIIGLEKRGIPVNIYYPKPLHMLPAFASLGHAPDDFPVALDISRRILALPFHPYLDEKTIDYICENLEEALQ